MLKITDLSVSYGAINAVHGISLEINEGEIVALIGNNGAGKTSTLKAICGIQKPSGGTVEFLGQKLNGLTPDRVAKKGIAMAPEGRGIFTRLTVMENLDMGAFLRKDKDGIKKDKERIFGLFPILDERKTQKAGTLSGGEQQMLAIGRALMAAPKIILLDEPPLGLAPKLVL